MHIYFNTGISNFKQLHHIRLKLTGMLQVNIFRKLQAYVMRTDKYGRVSNVILTVSTVNNETNAIDSVTGMGL